VSSPRQQNLRSARPTSADVARLAGVSRATVSYVLNGRRDVPIAEATRQQVLDAAEQLDYHPSPAARALRAGHGDVVLVLLPEWAVGQFADILADLGRLIAGHGLVCLRHEGRQWEGNLAHLLARVTAAVVVTVEPLGAGDAAALERAGVPEVRLWWLDNPGHLHSSAIDQADVVRVQVDHLLDRGYRRLAYLALEDRASARFIDVRIAAFQGHVRTRGLRDAMVAVEPAEHDALRTRLAGWSRVPSPLGVCAWSDVTALAALGAARTLGLDVPGDFGIIGVDDTTSARLAVPALSSVRLDLSQEAALAAHNIAHALGIDSQAPARTESVQLVRRSSS
jgi:DNA-binding LacI/PurR family transcriptional regulator